MIAIMIIGAAGVMIVGAFAVVAFTLSGRSIGMDATYERHGRNQPSHVHGHPGYELSDYQAFTQAILKARMIARRNSNR
jgi:hypothetical protein